MTLVILCGCLRPGADGVGDYSRLLAAACCQAGVPTHLLALHDPHVCQPDPSSQETAGQLLECLRLPASLPWSARLALAEQQLQAWNCRALSLQFVPYAFDRRGLSHNLPALIAALAYPTARDQAPRRLHLMFHEIWIGLNRSSSLRSRIIGRLQRRVIAQLHHHGRPHLVHTSNGPYSACLRSIGIQAQQLPLYSNLPQPPTPVQPEPGHFTACLFGRIPPEWAPEPVLEALVAEAGRRQCRPRLRVLGRPHRSAGWLNPLRERWPWLEIEDRGPVACPRKLAGLIQASNLGLATTPWALVEKSGAVAAFLSLGVPVLVSRNDWQLRRRWGGSATPTLAAHANLFPLSQWGCPTPGPSYVPPTPQQVASRLLHGLDLPIPMPSPLK
jgi:hypothetical protein